VPPWWGGTLPRAKGGGQATKPGCPSTCSSAGRSGDEVRDHGVPGVHSRGDTLVTSKTRRSVSRNTRDVSACFVASLATPRSRGFETARVSRNPRGSGRFHSDRPGARSGVMRLRRSVRALVRLVAAWRRPSARASPRGDLHRDVARCGRSVAELAGLRAHSTPAGRLSPAAGRPAGGKGKHETADRMATRRRPGWPRPDPGSVRRRRAVRRGCRPNRPANPRDGPRRRGRTPRRPASHR
jgi:hypothetical protein